MALGVGTYSDGFGVAFTLLDQFSAVARKIESSMSSLTAKSTAFAGAMNKGLGYGYAPAREARVVANETIALASITEAAAIDKLAMDYRLAASTIKLAEANEAAAIREAVAQAETAQLQMAATARQTAINEAMNRSNQRRAMEAIEARRLEMLAEIEAANAAAASAAIAEAANARVQASLVGLGAAVIGLALVIKGAKVDELFQKEELAIQGFVGSADKAHAAFMELQADANFNPMMGLENMLKTHSLLLSQNTPIEQSLRLTRNLSNMLTAVGRGAPELSRVGRELEKIAAMGHLTGRELNQAAAAGIPLRQLLEDYFGRALPNTLKDFPITIDDLDKALELAMRTGGRFSKAFEKMSESIMFQFARLKNEITYTFLAIGKAVEPITVTVGAALTGLFTTLKLFSQSWLGQAFWVITTSLLAFTAAVSLATLGGKGMSMVLGKMAHGLGYATYATLKATLATQGYATTLGMITKTIMANPMFKWFAILAAGTALVTNANKHFKKVMEGQEEIVGGVTGSLQRLGAMFTFLTEAVSTYDSKTKSSTFSNAMYDAIVKMGMADRAQRVVNAIGAIMSVIDGMWDVFGGLLTMVSGAIGRVVWGVSKLIEGIGWMAEVVGFASLQLNAMRVMGWLLAGVLLTINLRALWLTQTFERGIGLQAVAGVYNLVKAFLAWNLYTNLLSASMWRLALGVGLVTMSAVTIGLAIWGIVESLSASSDAATNLSNDFSGVTKSITEADIAMRHFNARRNAQTNLDNTRVELAYERKMNPHSSRVRELLSDEKKYKKEIKSEQPYISSPDAINMQQVQSQEAGNKNSMWSRFWEGLQNTEMDLRKPKEEKEVSYIIQIDGKNAGRLLTPHINAEQKKNAILRTT